LILRNTSRDSERLRRVAQNAPAMPRGARKDLVQVLVRMQTSAAR
jgi:hypothetical protein